MKSNILACTGPEEDEGGGRWNDAHDPGQLRGEGGGGGIQARDNGRK